MRILNLLIVLAGVSAHGAADAASIVAAGYASPTPVIVAPGQIVTFFVSGVGAGLTGPVRASTAPLPASLAGISATYDQGGDPEPFAIPIIHSTTVWLAFNLYDQANGRRDRVHYYQRFRIAQLSYALLLSTVGRNYNSGYILLPDQSIEGRQLCRGKLLVALELRVYLGGELFVHHA